MLREAAFEKAEPGRIFADCDVHYSPFLKELEQTDDEQILSFQCIQHYVNEPQFILQRDGLFHELLTKYYMYPGSDQHTSPTSVG